MSQFLKTIWSSRFRNTPRKRRGKCLKRWFVKQARLLDSAGIWLFSGSPEFFVQRVVAFRRMSYSIFRSWWATWISPLYPLLAMGMVESFWDELKSLNPPTTSIRITAPSPVAMVVWNGAGSRPYTCACWLLSCSHTSEIERTWRLIPGTPETDSMSTNGLDPKWGWVQCVCGVCEKHSKPTDGMRFSQHFSEKPTGQSGFGHCTKSAAQIGSRLIGNHLKSIEPPFCCRLPNLERSLCLCVSQPRDWSCSSLMFFFLINSSDVWSMVDWSLLSTFIFAVFQICLSGWWFGCHFLLSHR